MRPVASQRSLKNSTFRNSSRSLPLNLSLYPFDPIRLEPQGDPGSMNKVLAPTLVIQSRTAWAANSVIRSNVNGNAPLHHEVSQDGENALAVHATRNLDRQALTRELVDHGEHTELTPFPGAVLHEVISPDVVGTLGPEPYARTVIQPEPTALRLFLGNTKALPPPDPSNTLVVQMPAVAPEQCGNPPIAVATILAGKLNDRSR